MAVIWSNEARHDVARIFDFNAAYDEDRAAKIDRRLIEAAALIERNPLIGRPVGQSGVRERSLTDIQHVGRYRVSEDGIEILRVHHTRENREGA